MALVMTVLGPVLRFPRDRIDGMQGPLQKEKVHEWPDGVILDLNLGGTPRDKYLDFFQALREDSDLITSKNYRNSPESVIPIIAPDRYVFSRYHGGGDCRLRECPLR